MLRWGSKRIRMLLVVHTGGVMQILLSVMLRVFFFLVLFFHVRFPVGIGYFCIQAEFCRRDISGATSKRESSSFVWPRSCLISIFIPSSSLFSEGFQIKTFYAFLVSRVHNAWLHTTHRPWFGPRVFIRRRVQSLSPSSLPLLMVGITLETYKTARKIFGENCELRHIVKPFSSSFYVVFNFLFPLSTFCSYIPVLRLVWKEDYEY